MNDAPLSALVTTDEPSPAATATSLSHREKASYGLGELPVAIRMASFNNFLLFFYTNVIALSPSLAGLALALGRVWDGVNDPLVGYLSDNTSSRFGRRRPYLLASAIPLSLTFYLLWNPPTGLDTWGSFLFLTLAYVAMDACFTFYATPYLALGAELSPDYHERTRITTLRAVFHIIGALLALMCFSNVAGMSPATLQEGAGTVSSPYSPELLRLGFGQMGALLAAVMAISGLIAFYGCREALAPEHQERMSFAAFVRSLTAVLNNKPFRIELLSFALLVFAWAFHQPLTIYVYRDWLIMGQQLPTVMFLFFAATAASLGLWSRLAGRLGKNRALQICLAWSIVILLLFPFMRADMPRLWFYAFIVMIGLGAGGYALPPAIVADIIDYDEFLTGRRREGAFFGLWTLVMKFMSAAAIALVGVGLDLIGYAPNQPQTASTLWGLKVLYGPAPACFLLLSLLIFLRFPLTRESHAAVQRELQARRRQTGR